MVHVHQVVQKEIGRSRRHGRGVHAERGAVDAIEGTWQHHLDNWCALRICILELGKLCLRRRNVLVFGAEVWEDSNQFTNSLLAKKPPTTC